MKTQSTLALVLSLALIPALFNAACHKQPSAPSRTANDISGAYALLSVDGKPVPASVAHAGATLLVRSGTFIIRADGTCSSTISLVPPSGTEATREVEATYTRNGPKLVMRWKGAGQTTGTVSGPTFTMNNEGMIFVYRK